MRGSMAIATRELSSYFRQPAGWIIIALYLLLAGLVFGLKILTPGEPASLRSFFTYSGILLLPVVPAISMRLIAEEIRLGTIEGLLTAPIKGAGLVIGKFMGAGVFLLLMLAPTALYVLILFRVAQPRPDIGPIISGYLCLLLTGLLYLSIGTLASSLTSNSTLAFMMTLFAILGLMLLENAADQVPERVKPVLFALTLTPRIVDFARGVVDTGHIVFFISAAAWFLVWAIAAVELRRWR
jgi:gliding motility-associated transport system permease protein